MLSNIINNAVDAIEHDNGDVTVRLSIADKNVMITVQDNGKGMEPCLIEKLMNNVSVTHGKEKGHGIGMTQVVDTIKNNNGAFHIESQVNIGTKMVIKFALFEKPEWMSDFLKLNSNDTIVVVDDDSDIHGAMDAYLNNYIENYKAIRVRHFTQAQDAADFIQSLSSSERDKIVLLTDYELIGQTLNGLSLADLLSPIRAILITSHYENHQVQSSAHNKHIQIVPKQLIHELPVFIEEV